MLWPSESVWLSDGRTAVVRRWGAREVSSDVPALVGRVAAKLVPFADQLAARQFDAVLGPLVAATVQDALDLVLFSATVDGARLTREDLDRLPDGADLLRLARAMLRQNAGFFAECAGLYADVVQSRGAGSR